MKKLIVNGVLILIFSITLFLVKSDSSIRDFGINVLATASLFVLEYIVEHFNRIILSVKAATVYSKRRIRLSISYLYQIEVEGKYLLIRGKRISGQFQPVGGVYKRTPESFYFLRKLQVRSDDNIPIDDKSDHDLRINLPGEYLMRFLRWFDSYLGREVSPIREFHEELLNTGLLSREKFPYPSYIFLGRHQTPIHYSEHFRCHEILIADIFRLALSQAQCDELKKLMNRDSEEYIWVTSSEIERGYSNNGKKISITSEWII